MRNRELLDDIINEPGTSELPPAPEFEAAVFRKTVGAARRVRRVRIATRVAVVALVGVLALLQFKTGRQTSETLLVTTPVAQPEEAESSYVALRSQAFTGIIQTEQKSPILFSQVDAVTVLRTDDAGLDDVKLLSDEELLAFFSGQPVALVKHGPHDAELLFLDHK